MNQNLRNPGLAAVFSFIFSGLGQIYNGQIFKGLFIVSLLVLSMLVLIIGAIFIGLALNDKIMFSAQMISGIALFLGGSIFICIISIYSILDAWRVATREKK